MKKLLLIIFILLLCLVGKSQRINKYKIWGQNLILLANTPVVSESNRAAPQIAILKKNQVLNAISLNNKKYWAVRFGKHSGYVDSIYLYKCINYSLAKATALIRKAVVDSLERAYNISHSDQDWKDSIKSTDKYIAILKKYGKKYAFDICTYEPKIGMTEDMIIDLKEDDPTKINRSNYSFGVFDQFVYKDDIMNTTEYYYFKNGRLTSWQE